MEANVCNQLWLDNRLTRMKKTKMLGQGQYFNMDIKHTEPQGSKQCINTSLICFVVAVITFDLVYFLNNLTLWSHVFIMAPLDQGKQRAPSLSRKRMMVTFNTLLLLCFAFFSTRWAELSILYYLRLGTGQKENLRKMFCFNTQEGKKRVIYPFLFSALPGRENISWLRQRTEMES